MKVVRDHMAAVGGGKVRIGDPEEILQLLKAKLREEVAEVETARKELDLVEELADVVEVAYAIATRMSFDLDRVRHVKRAKKGGFDRGVILLYEAKCLCGADKSQHNGLLGSCTSTSCTEFRNVKLVKVAA